LLNREEWIHLAHKLDWQYSYAREEEIFPEVISGGPYLPHSEWQDWEESFKTSYPRVRRKPIRQDMAVYAVEMPAGKHPKIGYSLG
jgi:toluene monooxygenase system protein A